MTIEKCENPVSVWGAANGLQGAASDLSGVANQLGNVMTSGNGVGATYPGTVGGGGGSIPTTGGGGGMLGGTQQGQVQVVHVVVCLWSVIQIGTR